MVCVLTLYVNAPFIKFSESINSLTILRGNNFEYNAFYCLKISKIYVIVKIPCTSLTNFTVTISWNEFIINSKHTSKVDVNKMYMKNLDITTNKTPKTTLTIIIEIMKVGIFRRSPMHLPQIIIIFIRRRTSKYSERESTKASQTSTVETIGIVFYFRKGINNWFSCKPCWN